MSTQAEANAVRIRCPGCKAQLGFFEIHKGPYLPDRATCPVCGRDWFVNVLQGSIQSWNGSLFIHVAESVYGHGG